MPPARQAPKGIAGMFDTTTQPYALLDTSAMPPNMVLLNVYDVGDMELIQDVNRFSTMNDSVLLGGVYHAGVEVYGREWAYGYTVDDRTGVGPNPPRCNMQHTYRATIKMGRTRLSEADLDALLTNMSLMPEWQGPVYNFLHHNCLDFSNSLCLELGVGHIPGWIDRFGRTGRAAQKLSVEVRTIGAAMAADIGGAFRDIGSGVAHFFSGPALRRKKDKQRGQDQEINSKDLPGSQQKATSNDGAKEKRSMKVKGAKAKPPDTRQALERKDTPESGKEESAT